MSFVTHFAHSFLKWKQWYLDMDRSLVLSRFENFVFRFEINSLERSRVFVG